LIRVQLGREALAVHRKQRLDCGQAQALITYYFYYSFTGNTAYVLLLALAITIVTYRYRCYGYRSIDATIHLLPPPLACYRLLFVRAVKQNKQTNKPTKNCRNNEKRSANH